MKKRVIITDLTRMKDDRVCVFGIDSGYNGIRPVLPDGVNEKYAIENRLKPFNEIEFELNSQFYTTPPHVEDHPINTEYTPKFIRALSEEDKKSLLDKILDDSVEDIFDARIHEGKYINEGEGRISIGTVKSLEIVNVEYFYRQDEGSDYRITFTDKKNKLYDIPVTDLRFRYYCDLLRVKEGLEPDVISAEIGYQLGKSETYLRVGVGRPFKEKENRCYLFVTGVYSFPDYKRHLAGELPEGYAPTHKESKEGVSLADRYAELKAKEAEFKRWYEREYERIKEELVIYAKRENTEYIDGTDSRVLIKITDVFRFPETRTQDRNQLEQELKNRGFWVGVSMLNVRLLDKGLRDGKFNKELEGILERYAKKEESAIIRLIRIGETQF